jgi:hypothetical protein
MYLEANGAVTFNCATSVNSTLTLNTTTADYIATMTNVQDSSQGLLIRATDNDTTLCLLSLQGSAGATCQTWVNRLVVTKDGTKYFGNPAGSRFQMNASGENLYQYTNNYYIWGLYNDSNSLSVESAFGGCIIFRAQGQSTSSCPTTATERMRINSAGNVGIGITDDNPIGNGGTYRNLLVGNGAGYGVFQGISTATATNSTIVAFSGGTTGASANKNGGSINLELDGTSTSAAIGRWVFYTNNGTAFAERMRITSAGVLEVKKNILAGLEYNASQYLSISENQIYRTGNGTMYINNSATGEVIINQYGGATCVNGTNGYGRAVTNSSDERIKKNIIKIDNALEKIISMDGVYYEFDSENNLGISVPSGNIRIGLIAQQIENILPEAVFTSTEENEPKSIDYSGMIGLLIEGMKEQQCIICSQSQKIALLESCIGIV